MGQRQDLRNGCGCIAVLITIGAAVVGVWLMGLAGLALPLVVGLAMWWAVTEAVKSAGDPPSTLGVDGPNRYANNLGEVLASGEEILHFEYADVNGVVTERAISSWAEYARHVRGFCLEAADYRTFRKDRVLEWRFDTEKHLVRPRL